MRNAFQKGRGSGRATGRPAGIVEVVSRGSHRGSHREAKRAWIDEYKLSRGCMDCGYKEHSVALDFDHVRGEKLINVGTAVDRNASWQRIFDEVAKCEVVCANCHRVRTKQRRQYAVATA